MSQFKLGTLLLFVTACAVACFLTMQQRERMQSIERENRRDWIQEGVDWAQVVADGDLVLIRKGTCSGAFLVKRQTKDPKEMQCEWWYRDDANGNVFANEKSVSHGFSTVDSQLQFGTFRIQWSPATNNFGWISLKYPPERFESDTLPEVYFSISRNHPQPSLDIHAEPHSFSPLPINWPYPFYLVERKNAR